MSSRYRFKLKKGTPVKVKNLRREYVDRRSYEAVDHVLRQDLLLQQCDCKGPSKEDENVIIWAFIYDYHWYISVEQRYVERVQHDKGDENNV